MSSLLSNDSIAYRTGIFARHFDTFSSGRNLIVHKEPLQTINSTAINVYAGYGETSNESNITYTPVSGIFPVIQVYDKNQSIINRPDIQTLSSVNKARIKVKEDARQFIKNGRNESFELDGLTFNAIGEETVQNFFGLKYYYFTLTSTL